MLRAVGKVLHHQLPCVDGQQIVRNMPTTAASTRRTETTFDGGRTLWGRFLSFSCCSRARGSAFLGRRLSGLGKFVAQLVDLAAIGVVEVFDALLSMGAFKLHVCSGGLTLRSQLCQVAAQVRRRLTSTVQVGPDSRKLAPHLFDCCFAAIGTLRLRLGATLGHAGTPDVVAVYASRLPP